MKRIMFSEEDDKIAYYESDQIYIINNLNEILEIQLKGECYAVKFNQ